MTFVKLIVIYKTSLELLKFEIKEFENNFEIQVKELFYF